MLDSEYLPHDEFQRFLELAKRADRIGYRLDKDGEGSELFRITKKGTGEQGIVFTNDRLDAIAEWLS